MDIKATKLALVQSILDTKEEAILEQIKLIFDSSRHDWWDAISDENKNTIEEGINQLNRGEGILHDEANRRIKQKLNTGNG